MNNTMNNTMKISEERLERVKSLLVHDTRLARYCGSEYRDGSVTEVNVAGPSASYGNFEYIEERGKVKEALATLYDEPEHDLYLFPPNAGGSDYSPGSLTTRANYEVLKSELEDTGALVDVYGGHGTFAIAVSVKWLLTDDEEEYNDQRDNILTILESLGDAMLLDDSTYAELFGEAQDDAWEDWACSDFISVLENWYDCELDIDSEPANADNPNSMGYFRQLFEEVAQRVNAEWINEEGTSVYIDVKKIAGDVTSEELEPFVREERIRVFQNKNWHSFGTHKLGSFTCDTDLYQDVYSLIGDAVSASKDEVESEGNTYTWEFI